MKKFILTIVFCILITVSSQAQNLNSKVPTNDVISSVYNASVQIYSYEGKEFGICSGTLIRKNVVLTAKHCVEYGNEFYVNNVKVKNIIVSPEHDLALVLLVKNLDKDIVQLEKVYQLKRGDYLFGFGKLLEGDYPIVAKYLKNSPKLGIAVGQIKRGCSGAGVFNTQGLLVGVWVRRIEKDKLAFFESLEDIKEFLNNNLK